MMIDSIKGLSGNSIFTNKYDFLYTLGFDTFVQQLLSLNFVISSEVRI